MAKERVTVIPSIKEQFDSASGRRGGLKQNPPKPITHHKIPGTESSIRILGSEEDVKILGDLIDRSAKSDFAREGMEIAAKGGYTLEFTHVPGAGGECTQDGQFISLSPHVGKNELVSILAHEMRHAGQFERGGDEKFGIREVKSEIIHFRAMEADAQAAGATVCYELAEKGDKGPLDTMRRAWPEIVEPYEEAISKDSDAIKNGKASTAAFKGWYDNVRIKAAYERGYEVADMQKALKEGTEGDRPYNIKISGKKAVETTCWTSGGGNYFTDNPDILETGKYMDVSAGHIKFFKDYFKTREERTGKAPDTSVDEIPVRNAFTPEMMKKIEKETDEIMAEAMKKIDEWKKQNPDKDLEGMTPEEVKKTLPKVKKTRKPKKTTKSHQAIKTAQKAKAKKIATLKNKATAKKRIVSPEKAEQAKVDYMARMMDNKLGR